MKKSELYFAGGCFWGVEKYFQNMPWILETEAGYANGSLQSVGADSPSYQEVRSGETGFAETVRVVWDAEALTVTTLVRRFFDVIDPLSQNKQGNDVGTQYRTGVYYGSDFSEQESVQKVFAEVEKKLGVTSLMTEFLPLKNFFRAESEHQSYLTSNTSGYCHIPVEKLNQTFELIDAERYPRPSLEQIRKKLSGIQFSVTQESDTEEAFTGETWDNYKKGIYVDIVTGEPLFISAQKYESGCGWPSFSRPIDESVIQEFHDDSIPGRTRVEVRSRSGTHLGHVFSDGPKETDTGVIRERDTSAESFHDENSAKQRLLEQGLSEKEAEKRLVPQESTGLRYCINSASLEFIPSSELNDRGYGYLMELL